MVIQPMVCSISMYGSMKQVQLSDPQKQSRILRNEQQGGI